MRRHIAGMDANFESTAFEGGRLRPAQPKGFGMNKFQSRKSSPGAMTIMFAFLSVATAAVTTVGPLLLHA
jgi:hypothetical protein